MNESTLPSNFKCCATCAYWAGSARGDYLGLWVTYIEREDKCCCGSGFYNMDMHPLAMCGSWEQRYKPR